MVLNLPITTTILRSFWTFIADMTSGQQPTFLGLTIFSYFPKYCYFRQFNRCVTSFGSKNKVNTGLLSHKPLNKVSVCDKKNCNADAYWQCLISKVIKAFDTFSRYFSSLYVCCHRMSLNYWRCYIFQATDVRRQNLYYFCLKYG